MGKFNNRKNTQCSKDRKLFFDTINDMRSLIEKNTSPYTAETLGLGKKVKMPYNHLIGRRKAIRNQYRHEKSRAREQGIQYDSSMKMLNSELMTQKRQKDEYEKNKYKYEGMGGNRIGRESQGLLEIGKKDLERIYGGNEKKQDGKSGNSFRFRGKGKRKNKNKNKKGRKKH